MDREKVIKGLAHCTRPSEVGKGGNFCMDCPYTEPIGFNQFKCNGQQMKKDALALLKEQEKEIKALRLLIEWAEECNFGFDQFHDEYELYKDEIKDMKYIDGMIHVAKRTLEDHGAFEEGR